MNHLKDTFYHIKHKDDQQLLQQLPGQQPPSSAQQGKDSDKGTIRTTQRAIDIYLLSKQPNGEVGGIGYWQSGNGYTAIALHDAWSGLNHNATVLRDQLSLVEKHHHHFINEFNDDTLWWAQCLLDFYQTNPNRHHLDTAKCIWAHTSRSMIGRNQIAVHDKDMCGGVTWTTRDGEDQVNAITTGLFAELSARLALLERSPQQRNQYLDAAELSFDWIIRCRYRESQCLVLDNIKLKTQECVDWTFTYRTGQAVAAASVLFLAKSHTPEGLLRNDLYNKPASTYLILACDMARRSLTYDGWVDADGILTEWGKDGHDPWKNDDAIGFKSILLRSLAKLYKLLRDNNLEQELQQDLRNFIRKQYDSLHSHDTNGNGQYGPWWNGPMEAPTSHSQLAALDVMAAIHLLRT